jgi:hypothetical protein
VAYYFLISGIRANNPQKRVVENPHPTDDDGSGSGYSIEEENYPDA